MAALHETDFPELVRKGYLGEVHRHGVVPCRSHGSGAPARSHPILKGLHRPKSPRGDRCGNEIICVSDALGEQVGDRAQPMGSKVSFVPYRPIDEVPEVYRSADILVIPSQVFDACPLVLFEWMETGLAMLTTRQGCIPEVGDEAIQYFDTPEQLTTMLHELIAHPENRAAWGGKARIRAQEFTWDRSLETRTEIVTDTAPGSEAVPDRRTKTSPGDAL